MPTIFIVLAIVTSLSAFAVFFFVFRQMRREQRKETELTNSGGGDSGKGIDGGRDDSD